MVGFFFFGRFILTTETDEIHSGLSKYSGVVLGSKFESLRSDISAGGRGYEQLWPRVLR